MVDRDFKHRLAALLSADVVGYSRLMAEDEVGAIRTLTAYRAEMTTHVRSQGGRVVNFVGDNLLAEFTSTLDAVECALNIQNTLTRLNEKLAANRQMYIPADSSSVSVSDSPTGISLSPLGSLSIGYSHSMVPGGLEVMS